MVLRVVGKGAMEVSSNMKTLEESGQHPLLSFETFYWSAHIGERTESEESHNGGVQEVSVILSHRESAIEVQNMVCKDSAVYKL
jgi:hypothetical protein